MPLKLDKSDKRLLTGFGLTMFGLFVVLGFFGEAQQEENPFPSTYSVQSGGAKGAYLLLLEGGYNIERWERAPTNLPEDGHGTLLILAEPYRFTDRDDRHALQRFLTSGGRVLAVGFMAAIMLPQNEATVAAYNLTSRRVKPQIPSPITRGGEISMVPDNIWKTKNPDHVAHYADAEGALVVTYPVGEGEVIWWADDLPLTNAGMKEAGNLELLINTIGSKEDTHILWDEYYHGREESVWDNNYIIPMKWALAQLAILGLAVIATHSRRVLPVRPVFQPPRLSPIEFVETMGGVYEKANAVPVALEVSLQRFRQLLVRRLGVSSSMSSADLAKLANLRLASVPDLREVMERCEQAIHDPALKPAEALHLTQRLNEFSRALKLIKAENKP